MMQRSYKIVFLFAFTVGNVYASVSESVFEPILAQYETALTDLIDVYQSMQPPLPIQFNQTDIVGATYHKIIRPYVLEIQGYSRVVMSAYSRKYPYSSDMQVLQSKFQECSQKVMTLSKLFPQAMQQDAVNYFYNQLTDSLVQNCTKILQDIAYNLNTDQDSLGCALIAYTLAWNAQTPTMKLTGFADIATFKSNITTWVLNVYQAAIAQATSSLQKAHDRTDLYDQIASYYQTLAMVYTNSGQLQKATVEKQNATQIQAQKAQYVQAKSLIESAQKLADTARSQILVNYVQPVETTQNIQNVLTNISNAYKQYESALAMYTTLQDSGAIARCQTAIDFLQGDFALRRMQLLWLNFVQNIYVSANSADSIQAFDDLQNFYASDPTKTTISIAPVVQALNDVLLLCSQTPNNFDANFSIVSLLQSATTSYQAAMVGAPNNQQNSSFLLDMKGLQELQAIINASIQIFNGMIAVSQGKAMISGSNILAQMMVQAKKIDGILAKNSSLKSFLYYLPLLDTTSQANSNSYQSFIVQYVYRIALHNVQSYLAPSSNQAAQNEVTMMLALSDLITVQGYKNYITDVQLQELQNSIIALAQAMNIEQFAQKIYKQAQGGNNWTNTTTSVGVYQSQTDSLWNIAISLCEIGIDLSMLPNVAAATKLSTTSLQAIYIAVLQDYIKAFVANAEQFVGYQLHVFAAVYKLYTVTSLLHQSQPTVFKDTTIVPFAYQTLTQLFGGTNGFFAQAKQAQEAVKAAGITAQQKSQKEELVAQLMNQITVTIEQQDLAIDKIVQLFSPANQPSPMLTSITDDTSMTVTMNLESSTYSVQLVNPIAVKINKLIAQIATAQAAATQAEGKQNFALAATLYGDIKAYCLELLSISQSSDQQQKYKDAYFLANTRFTASSLAAQVITNSTFALDALKNIPKDYYIQGYHLNNVDMQLFGSAIPESLQSLSSLTVLSGAQMQDAIAIFKAYIVYQLLQPQGLTFSSCYSGYTLQRQPGLSTQNSQTLQEIEHNVVAYLSKWKNQGVSAIVNGAIISFVFDQLPVSPIIPFYASGPYAAIYFIGASELFQPGTSLVDNGQYVPGQDEASYSAMLQSIAYAYVAAAHHELSNAEKIAVSLLSEVKKAVAANVAIDDAVFMKKYDKIKKGFIAAQSLLFATNSSAYYYFNVAQQANNAQIVKKIFLKSYSQQVEILSQFLIGNPVSNRYNTVLSDLNQVYLSWCVELDPVKDAAKIAQNKKNVVELFENAGNACMNYAYKQTMFPNLQQYHYGQAASNYEAARQQYLSMVQDQGSASAMQGKALQAYFLASTQRVQTYYYAKNNGLVYTPVAMVGYDSTVSTQPTQISFADLFASYQSFENAGNPNQGKIDAYNDVLNLLLEAAMYFEYLAGVYAKKITTTESTQPKAKKKAALNPQLLAYLQKQNILSAQADVIPYVQSDILPKLFALADQLFVAFNTNVEVLADWCNALYTAIQYQYIDDYQGGINPNISTSDQASEFLKKWQAFSIAMQKESSALENPSSAYIG